jgi:hypothetical protein
MTLSKLMFLPVLALGFSASLASCSKPVVPEAEVLQEIRTACVAQRKALEERKPIKHDEPNFLLRSTFEEDQVGDAWSLMYKPKGPKETKQKVETVFAEQEKIRNSYADMRYGLESRDTQKFADGVKLARESAPLLDKAATKAGLPECVTAAWATLAWIDEAEKFQTAQAAAAKPTGIFKTDAQAACGRFNKEAGLALAQIQLRGATTTALYQTALALSVALGRFSDDLKAIEPSASESEKSGVAALKTSADETASALSRLSQEALQEPGSGKEPPSLKETLQALEGLDKSLTNLGLTC